MDTAATPSGKAGRYEVNVARWLLLAFAVFVLVVLGGLYVINNLPVIYTATTEIQVLPRGQLLATSVLPTDQPFDPTAFQAEFTILQSSDVLLPVIKDLNLEKIWTKRVFKSGKDQLSDLEALNYMDKILKFDFVRGTNIVNITATSDSPQEAADIANAVAQSYKKMRDRAEADRGDQGINALRGQIAQQQKVVDEKKAALETMQAYMQFKLHGGSWETETDDLLPTREKDLLTAKEDYDARRVLLGKVTKVPNDEFISTLEGLGKPEPELKSLLGEAVEKKIEIDSLVKSGTPQNDPHLISLQDEEFRKTQQVKDLIAGLRRAMQVDTEMAKSRVDLLQKEVDDLKAKFQQELPTIQSYRKVQREFEQQQLILYSLKVRTYQTIAGSAGFEIPVRIIALAQPPRYPSSPNKLLDLVVTVLGGIVLGAVVATIVEIGLWFFQRAKERAV